MADELKNNKLNEGYTEFNSINQRVGTNLSPVGRIGKFLASFFATKAQKEAVELMDGEEIQGDTIVTDQVIKQDGNPAAGSVNRTYLVSQLELNRKKRYAEYEKMDEYPEIGAAFDIYADESTQKGLKGERWTINSGNDLANEEIEKLFRTIDLKSFLWDIVRNTVKYGDNFIELILDTNKPKMGVRKVKILNPNYILRKENEFGYLEKFMQEVPNEQAITYGHQADQQPLKLIDLDKHQIVHFRLHTSDPVFYPYGKSIAALSHRIYRSLKMMEDAMMIYRITRAPERRIFYVDTGNLPTGKAEAFMERLKAKFKKEKFYNPSKGNVDSRFNPMSMDEDYFVPMKNGKGTQIETLPGAQNLDQIDDVLYYRDKLLASLKIPKDYIVEKDKSPERKANLSQLDAKFGRAISRIQQSIEKGLEEIAKRHLQLRGFPASIVREVEISLPEASDVAVKRKLEIDEQKIRILQAVQGLGLLSKDAIYREYFEYSEDEVRKMKAEVKKEQEEQKQYDLAAAGAAGAEGGAGNIDPNGAAPTPQPTTEETERSSAELLEILMEKTGVNGSQKLILDRMINKENRKIEDSTH